MNRTVSASARVALALLVVALSPSRTDSQSLVNRLNDARKANLTPSQFLRPIMEGDAPSSPNTTLLLFVHGIFGDTIRTWKHENGWSLPRRILDRPEFSGRLDAFAFGYPSAMLKAGSFTIPEAAESLLQQIQYFRLTSRYERIVIVAHSMGGLVALQALLSDPALARRVPVVVTYSTPYTGAEVAQLGELFLDNPGLANMVAIERRNGFLQSLRFNWRRARDNKAIATKLRCAYETVGLPNKRPIVEESSASFLCDGAPTPIGDDHLGVVKPGTATHASVPPLVNAIREAMAEPAADVSTDIGSCSYIAFNVMDPGPVKLTLDIDRVVQTVNVPADTPRGDGMTGVAILKGYGVHDVAVSVLGDRPGKAGSTSDTWHFAPSQTRFVSLGTGGHVADGNYKILAKPLTNAANDGPAHLATFAGNRRIALKPCSTYGPGVTFAMPATSTTATLTVDGVNCSPGNSGCPVDGNGLATLEFGTAALYHVALWDSFEERPNISVEIAGPNPQGLKATPRWVDNWIYVDIRRPSDNGPAKAAFVLKATGRSSR